MIRAPFFASLLAIPCLLGAQMASAPAAQLTPRDSALHALNRLAYGPRPGEVDRVAQMGVLKWIDQQLDPRHVPDDSLERMERQFQILRESPADLAGLFEDARRQREARLKANPAAADQPDDQPPKVRRLAGEFPELAVVRAAYSERQLQEVMVDFWTNHFNIYAGKGIDRYLLPDYIEHVIRPNALGNFTDLLVATAQSPAMLFYLDNWESVVPGAMPPQLARAQARARMGLFPRGANPARLDSAAKRLPKGINENYGRELMELHTLGVDGGYTQEDVIAAARILTGWSIEKPRQDPRFVFNDWAHDYGAKTVMGVSFPDGHGMDEGLKLLKMLATDPATVHHVSWQLCQRFVADDPPDGCVDDAVAAWRKSNGSIRAVLTAIFHGPDFWAVPNLGGKIKTPLEFVASALRASEATPDTTPRLGQVVARLGEPLFQHVAPDGYPETQEDWVNSGALLDRMNVAVGLAAGKLPGTQVDLDRVVPTVASHEALVDEIDRQLLGGAMTAHTRQVILDQIKDIADSAAARTFAVGLALGGPDFQKQ
ncbi:MAG TPA: DUF1800 domain-containing protein [Gemmatimonadales bacterium]|nr:DUF1800 domain-containing protein [Gemmatimonadales bacterium]